MHVIYWTFGEITEGVLKDIYMWCSNVDFTLEFFVLLKALISLWIRAFSLTLICIPVLYLQSLLIYLF